jgi:hypothetical protein
MQKLLKGLSDAPLLKAIILPRTSEPIALDKPRRRGQGDGFSTGLKPRIASNICSVMEFQL